jgi:hypothetical protein
MAAFGAAQIMYTAAFGFKPLNATLGAALYSFGATGELCASITPDVDEDAYMTVSDRLANLKQTVLWHFLVPLGKNWNNT